MCQASDHEISSQCALLVQSSWKVGMGRKTRVIQTSNTAKDEMEKSLANCEIETDGGQEKTHLAGSEAKTCLDLEIILPTRH